MTPSPESDAWPPRMVAHADPAFAVWLAAHGPRMMRDPGHPDRHAAPRLADGRSAERWQDDVIVRTVERGARVLDLGCGDGQLLARLAVERDARVQGVELDAQGVFACLERGVPVIQADLDDGLATLVGDTAHGPEYDYVILEETLQTLRRPAEVLRDMTRVGRRGIAGFPNFGYWRVRADLTLRGRMPVTDWLPHHWYDTPNIHCLSLRDFFDEAATLGLRVRETTVLADGVVRPHRPDDNLWAEEALFVFEGVDAPEA